MEEDKNLEFVECLVLYETFKQDINKKDLLQPELIVKAVKKKTGNFHADHYSKALKANPSF